MILATCEVCQTSDEEDNLRKKICDFLETNPLLIDGTLKTSDITPQEFSTYILNMRDCDTWGGGIEIKAFCEIYNYQVNVYIPNGKIISFSSDFFLLEKL